MALVQKAPPSQAPMNAVYDTRAPAGPGSATDSEPGPQEEPGSPFLDEERLLADNGFPIAPDQLVQRTCRILAAGVHKCPDDLDDDRFAFSAPFIGPLPKPAFITTMEALDLDTAFPDMQPRIYHVRCEPLVPGRVWFTTRPCGTNAGYFKGAGIPVPPTGTFVDQPPQTASLQFNPEGKVLAFTMEYVQDRLLGDTGGLGGAFGFLHRIGMPFPYPEGHPWQSSWQQRLFNKGGPLGKLVALVLDRASHALLPAWLLTAHGRNVP